MIPKKINILGSDWMIIQDKNNGGASFTFKTYTITLGVNYKNVEDIFEILIHEISEIIHIVLCSRFDDRGNDSYIFVMNHAKFQTHNEILVKTLLTNKIISL